ncbi:dsDNA nuclease domain-containing protein [Thalassospira australica]|uniref:dsDNA nuclease domain-containing protein n=1 Tax=Thalassospira australica TaxID=1528106 RepID=UPI00138DE69B|nr:dsDNA nuclease domain-containing protein [Thalassospira australica]
MADLFTDLTSKPQRETEGADSASRFDYQKDWAFSQMMRKHLEGESYLIAFEFHDDVVFVSPADQPTSVDFVQVKTSSGTSPRMLTTLTSRPKGKASVFGKMFSNFEGICSSYDIKVILVSNNAFEFAGGEACAVDLDEKYYNRIKNKLSSELNNFDEKRLEDLHFQVTGVSLEAMESFLEGEASALFCEKFGEDHGLNIRTWMRLVKSEIVRRNNFPSDNVKNAQQLFDKKCIEYSLVENTLSTMHARSRPSLDISDINSSLLQAGWTLAETLQLKKYIPEASTDFYDPLNIDVKSIVGLMEKSVFEYPNTPMELDKFLRKVVDDVMSDSGVAEIYKKRDYLRALGALVYYDQI